MATFWWAGSTEQLSIVQVGVHACGIVDEPGVDKVGGVGGVFRIGCDGVGDGIVENGVGHGLEDASVILLIEK